MKKKAILSLILVVILAMGGFAGCKKPTPEPETPPTTSETQTIKVNNLGEQNLLRQIQMLDADLFKYVSKNTYEMQDTVLMFDKYRTSTNAGTGGAGSVWKYTAMLEAVIKTLHNLKSVKTGNTLYTELYNYYAGVLDDLINGLEYFRGTADIISYNGTKEWSVFGVNRASEEGTANIENKEAVYDDQMWLIRELLEAYKLLGKEEYLTEAEYLTAYVLDGWDQSFVDDNNLSRGRNGGFPWGHGYSTKHSCSNGPMIAPLVWLYEIYADSEETIDYDVLTAPGVIETQTYNKGEFYLYFAEETYSFMVNKLMTPNGVFADMLNGFDGIETRVYFEGTANEIELKVTNNQGGQSGRPLAYNTGSPLSGAVELYRITEDSTYLDDIKTFCDKSFNTFTDSEVKSGYYAFSTASEYDPWFCTVLYRAYVEAYAYYPEVAVYISEVQKWMDHGYDNFYQNGLLPRNMLTGWVPGFAGDSDVAAIDTFSYISNFGILADFELNVKN